jgi:hypothetical protein
MAISKSHLLFEVDDVINICQREVAFLTVAKKHLLWIATQKFSRTNSEAFANLSQSKPIKANLKNGLPTVAPVQRSSSVGKTPNSRGSDSAHRTVGFDIVALTNLFVEIHLSPPTIKLAQSRFEAEKHVSKRQCFKKTTRFTCTT